MVNIREKAEINTLVRYWIPKTECTQNKSQFHSTFMSSTYSCTRHNNSLKLMSFTPFSLVYKIATLYFATVQS